MKKPLLKDYFSPIYYDKASFDDEKLKALSKQQEIKIEATKKHFEDLKEILNDDQIINYEKVVSKAIQNILGGKQGPPPHKKGELGPPPPIH